MKYTLLLLFCLSGCAYFSGRDAFPAPEAGGEETITYPGCPNPDVDCGCYDNDGNWICSTK